MLPALSVNSSEKTPSIILDQENQVFEISGRSLPENSLDFYQPVLDWINEYSRSPNPETHFVFQLEYMNTSSSKAILDILALLEEIEGTRVTWCTHPEDDDMKGAGMVLAELVNLPFGYQTVDQNG